MVDVQMPQDGQHLHAAPDADQLQAEDILMAEEQLGSLFNISYHHQCITSFLIIAIYHYHHQRGGLQALEGDIQQPPRQAAALMDRLLLR